jgi:hypothetical protein
MYNETFLRDTFRSNRALLQPTGLLVAFLCVGRHEYWKVYNLPPANEDWL